MIIVLVPTTAAATTATMDLVDLIDPFAELYDVQLVQQHASNILAAIPVDLDPAIVKALARLAHIDRVRAAWVWQLPITALPARRSVPRRHPPRYYLRGRATEGHTRGRGSSRPAYTMERPLGPAAAGAPSSAPMRRRARKRLRPRQT